MFVNIRLIAIEAGDILKWISTVNEIDRIGSAVFPFAKDTFPNDSIRNPTAHEPALHWPINEGDAPDLLSFISFLFRQLDKAVKHP